MKFSISFKYSNVTFKNKETKETVTFDTKAEGNTFTFDNVDEDVVLGIVKGIKDKKASQVFSYDDFRTNFINVMARNKCKELYDKLDKGGWKVEDIAISNITIKDLEFTKPTMNAREAITVESKNKTRMNESKYGKGPWPTWVVKERLVQLINGVSKEHPMWADLVEILEKYYGSMDVEKLVNESGSSLLDKEYHEVYLNGVEIQVKMREIGEFMRNEGFADHLDLMNRLNGVKKEMEEIMGDLECAVDDIWQDEYRNSDEFHDKIDRDAQASLDRGAYSENRTIVKEGSENIEPVIFKRDRHDGEVVAFFPETMFDGSVNKGNIMCYAHNGQSSEASIEYFQDCRPCKDESEYADLLAELEDYFMQDPDAGDVRLKVVKKPNYGRGPSRRQMWPSRF